MIRVVVDEARRQRWSMPARRLTITAVTLVAVVGLMMAELVSVGALIERNRTEVDAGRDVQLVRSAASDSPGVVSGPACEALTATIGVAASGSLRTMAPAEVSALPGVGFQRAAISPGLLEVLDDELIADRSLAADARHDAVYVGATTARELGLATGNIVSIDGESDTSRVVGVLDGPRSERFSRWILYETAAVDSMGECWIEFESNTSREGNALASALLPGPDPLVSARMLDWGALTAYPYEELELRWERLIWLPVGIVVGLLFGLTLWFRRTDVALVRALGFTRIETALMFSVEVALSVCVATLAGVVITAALAGWSDLTVSSESLLVALRSVIAAIGIVLANVMTTSWLLAGRSLADGLKDR